MADLLDGLAQYLTGRALVTYGPAGTGGDVAFEAVPQDPGEVVVFTLYGGPEADSKLPYDEPRLQVRVRGDGDRRTSYDRCKAIRSELHGLGSLTLPDGTFLVLCYALQTPAYLGQDDNGRHQHSCNFQLEVHAPTVHRPA